MRAWLAEHGAWLACAVVPWLVLWPAPLVWRTHLLSAGDQEAVQHLWGLWAAWSAGDSVLVHTDRLSWPAGFSFVLVDPGHVPLFGVVHALLGPAAAYNAVLLVGVALAGAAGALLARAAGADGPGRTLAAVVAMSAPAVRSAAGEGITESFSVGWVGIAAAALILHVRDERWRWGVLAALALGAAVWGGPYNAVWAALLCGAIGVAHLGVWRRTVPVGLAGLALSLPVVIAQLAWRREGLPGTGRMEPQLPAVESAWVVDGWRGGLKHGADLLDPWLPGVVTGGLAPAGHTAYLGVVVVGLAVVAVARDRSRWPWLAGAAAFVVLAIGPQLSVAGHLLHSAGDHGFVAWPAPVAALQAVVPGLGRLTRWYRAAGVAALLLAPLVAVAARRPGWVGALVVADALWLAPLPWPVVHVDGGPSAVWAAMDRPGAVVDLPPAQWAFVPPGRIRDDNLLQQAWHGRANTGTFFNLSGGAASSAEVQTLFHAALGEPLPSDVPMRLARYGYAWVAVDRHRVPPQGVERLEAALGPPWAEDARYALFALPVADRAETPRYPSWQSLGPVPLPGSGPVQVGPGGHRQPFGVPDREQR